MLETYYFLFGSTKYWYNILFKKGFSHLAIIKKDNLDDDSYFVVISDHNLKLSREKNVKDTFRDLKTFMNMKIIKVEVESECIFPTVWSFITIRWSFYTSVCMAKYLMGIKSFCMTPYGLYKFLRAKKDLKNTQILNIEII